MISMLPALFVASLIGSLHCAGMCGPLLSLYSADARATRTLPHLLYNLGRLASYLTLGSAAGFLGAGLDSALLGTGILGTAGLFAGLALVVWGMVSLIKALGFAPRFPGRALPITKLLSRIVMKAGSIGLRFGMPVRAFLVGLASAILPCGWLWAFVLVAAGSGSALSGAGTMFVFWLGTVPIMATLGVGLRGVFSLVGTRLKVITSVLLIATGWLTIAGRLQLSMAEMNPTGHEMKTTIEVPDPHAHSHSCRENE